MDDEQLGYIHDAVLTCISYVPAAEGKRLMLRLSMHSDCGYPDLNGKDLVLTFSDVTLVSCTLWAWVGVDTIDCIDRSISSSTKKKLRRLGTVDGSARGYQIAMHSGSEIDIVCQQLQWSMADDAGQPT